MFAKNYFAPTYFAASYFSPTVSAPAPVAGGGGRFRGEGGRRKKDKWQLYQGLEELLRIEHAPVAKPPFVPPEEPAKPRPKAPPPRQPEPVAKGAGFKIVYERDSVPFPAVGAANSMSLRDIQEMEDEERLLLWDGMDEEEWLLTAKLN